MNHIQVKTTGFANLARFAAIASTPAAFALIVDFSRAEFSFQGEAHTRSLSVSEGGPVALLSLFGRGTIDIGSGELTSTTARFGVARPVRAATAATTAATTTTAMTAAKTAADTRHEADRRASGRAGADAGPRASTGAGEATGGGEGAAVGDSSDAGERAGQTAATIHGNLHGHNARAVSGVWSAGGMAGGFVSHGADSGPSGNAVVDGASADASDSDGAPASRAVQR